MDKISSLHKDVINLLDSNKALDIVSIDLDGKSSIADQMIIASGTSSRHIQALSEQVYEFLKNLCKQYYGQPEVVTNVSKFYRDDFNNYKECIWWPHRDTGYNGIVYFSDECGTNLYSPEYFDKSKRIMTYEHNTPWIKKGEFKLLKTLEPKYNRLVFFDGLKFPHGMDICNDRFFDDEYRYNQVFFFNHPNYSFIDREQDI